MREFIENFKIGYANQTKEQRMLFHVAMALAALFFVVIAPMWLHLLVNGGGVL